MVIAMIHRGIQYTIAATAEPDIWRWQFQIGDSVRTGRTQTRLAELAARRVQSKIDTALRALVYRQRETRRLRWIVCAMSRDLTSREQY
jgi:hypothetical protein